MTRRYIIDTGPIVALLSERDSHHGWAKAALSTVKPPALTCEAVIAEAWHLLRGTGKGQSSLLELLSTGAIDVPFVLTEELATVRRLLLRYADRPMSLADACLVRMSELFDDAAVITLDRDFAVYRRLGRKTIPLLAPA